MSYFKSFSRINYSFDDGDTIKTCVDIVTRVGLKDKIKNFTEMFMDYDVEDGERPEVLADRIYGDPELHWIILISNEIHNQYYDWPMSQRQLNNHADRKHPGSSFFLTGVSGATWFPKETSYLKNDVIRGISGGTFGMTQGSVTSLIADDRAGLVHDWDKTYARLVVTSVSGDFASGDLITTLKSDADGSTIYNISRIGRAVDISHDAVHHFENPVDGSHLNPFGSAPVGVTGEQSLLGSTGNADGSAQIHIP